MPRTKKVVTVATVNFSDEVAGRLSALEGSVEELQARQAVTLTELRDAWAEIRVLKATLADQGREARYAAP